MPIPLAGKEVTLEEIDKALGSLASRCRFSSPAVRQSTAPDSHENPDELLRPLFHRLRSRDAKWLTRMLLKNYAPVIVPEYLVLKQYHFLLPELLKFQSSFDAVVSLLRGADVAKFPRHPEGESERERVRQAILQYLTPKVGVKVGRTAFFKARVRNSNLVMDIAYENINSHIFTVNQTLLGYGRPAAYEFGAKI